MNLTCNKHEFCWCNVARGFAMLALGVAVAHVKREDMSSHGITRNKMSKEKADKLKLACTTGQVKVLVPQPEPYEELVIQGSYGIARYPYGVNLEQRASFYGKKLVPIEMPVTARISAEALQAIAEKERHES